MTGSINRVPPKSQVRNIERDPDEVPPKSAPSDSIPSRGAAKLDQNDPKLLRTSALNSAISALTAAAAQVERFASGGRSRSDEVRLEARLAQIPKVLGAIGAVSTEEKRALGDALSPLLAALETLDPKPNREQIDAEARRIFGPHHREILGARVPELLHQLVELPAFGGLDERERALLLHLAGGANVLFGEPCRSKLRQMLEGAISTGDLQALLQSPPGRLFSTPSYPIGPSTTIPSSLPASKLDAGCFATDLSLWSSLRYDLPAGGPNRVLSVFAPKGFEATTAATVGALAAAPPLVMDGIRRITIEPKRPLEAEFYDQVFGPRGNPQAYCSVDQQNGDVWVYPGPTGDAAPLVRALCHEVAHTIAGRFLDHDAWKTAIASDRFAVSRYATTDHEEDFCESMTVYLLTQNTPAFSEMRDLMPARFAMIDRILEAREQAKLEEQQKIAGARSRLAQASASLPEQQVLLAALETALDPVSSAPDLIRLAKVLESARPSIREAVVHAIGSNPSAWQILGRLLSHPAAAEIEDAALSRLLRLLAIDDPLRTPQLTGRIVEALANFELFPAPYRAEALRPLETPHLADRPVEPRPFRPALTAELAPGSFELRSPAKKDGAVRAYERGVANALAGLPPACRALVRRVTLEPDGQSRFASGTLVIGVPSDVVLDQVEKSLAVLPDLIAREFAAREVDLGLWQQQADRDQIALSKSESPREDFVDVFAAYLRARGTDRERSLRSAMPHRFVMLDRLL